MIPLFDVRLGEAEIEAVAETLRSGWLTMGPRTEEFERVFAEHLGARHAVATSSCTAALHLAYLAAGVGPGDEVIVPAITFVATAAAVRYCGGTPVLADVIGQNDLGIDPESVAQRIGPSTKAVCAVHYAGYAARLDELRSLCDEHGLALIEDAAHSPAATLPGTDRTLGTIGLAGAFSFFSNKVLACGEGGLLATDDDDVAELARSLRSHAMSSGTWDRHRGHSLSYDVTGVGFNYRMDEPRAALLLARFPRLADDIAARRRLTARYRSLLKGVTGVTLPYSDEEVAYSSCYVMPMMLTDPAMQAPLRERLQSRWQVQTSLLYPAMHELTAYRDAGTVPMPRSELAARTQVTIPLFPDLSDSDQDHVVEAIAESLAELGGGSPTAAVAEARER